MSGGILSGGQIHFNPTPKRGTPPILAANVALETLIATLAEKAEAAALAPADCKAKNLEALRTFEGLLKAFEDGVRLTSSSSSPHYAMRDMPQAWQEHHARAKHAITLLGLLYGPQPAACDDPGAHH